jgi:DNA adenine methylase
MIRSPLRYPGGKSRVAEKIVSLIPDFKEFREPFVGGGSIFINLQQKFPDRIFWINDKYSELSTFWETLKSKPEKLIEQIWNWKHEYSDGKKLFYFLRENKDNFDEVKTAAMFFVFNRITFSGTTEAGGFSKQAFEKRFTESSIERLYPIPQILQNVKITNADYENSVNANGKDVFLFLDPPYFSATNSALYGKNGNLHKAFDHEKFAETLKNCSHKWILTYDDSPFIRELFSFAEISSWDLVYSMRNVTKKSDQKEKELLISNYSIQNRQEEQLAFEFSV